MTHSYVIFPGSSNTPPAERLISASSSSNRNSLGSRTAWLLPCLAVFMGRSEKMDTDSIYVEGNGFKRSAKMNCKGMHEKRAPSPSVPAPRFVVLAVRKGEGS